MRRSAFLLLLVLAAAQAWAQTSSPPAGREAAGEAQPPGLEVMYACPGGTDFAAVFSKDGDLATLTMPGQPQIELSRQHAGSGFAYGDSYYELRGRGREATLTAAGRSMRCHAAGRPGDPPRTYQSSGLTITLFPDGVFRLRELHDGAEPILDLGQWAQEVDGGVRLVLRGGTAARRRRRVLQGLQLTGELARLVLELLDREIDRRVQVDGLLLRAERVPVAVQHDLGAVTPLHDRQNHVRVDRTVEVLVGEPLHLGIRVLVQGVGGFHVPKRHVHLHESPPA